MMSADNLSNCVFLFAHGAGAGMDSEFMLSLSERLAAYGLEVKRFEFSYMKKVRAEGKRRPPDRMPKLLSSYEDQIRLHDTDKQIFIGGKSMGGRVASLLAAEKGELLNIKGVVCLGFPFHPPAKPNNYRGEHLIDIETPTLIVQGERDPFGTRAEIAKFDFSDQVQVEFLVDGDHSFKPRVKSGVTLEENLTHSAESIINFIKINHIQKTSSNNCHS